MAQLLLKMLTGSQQFHFQLIVDHTMSDVKDCHSLKMMWIVFCTSNIFHTSYIWSVLRKVFSCIFKAHLRRLCSISFFLLGCLFFGLFFALSQKLWHIREHEGAAKDECSTQPVEAGEWVCKVPDGKEEGEELPQGNHQGHRQAGALRGKDKHGGDAKVLGDDVAN